MHAADIADSIAKAEIYAKVSLAGKAKALINFSSNLKVLKKYV